MLKQCLINLREKNPLVHNITNYVTVNDCANILLACGASPIMADDKNEVGEITSICTALNINIGTLNSNTIESMMIAGKKSNELSHPILLDPVGVGASTLRTGTALELVEKVNFSVIRGNISEIKMLALNEGSTKGVDADIADAVSEDNIDEVVAFAKKYAKKTNAIIAITGAIDIVADSNQAAIIRNGNAMMSKITGTGCMLSAMTTAYIAANQDDMFTATVASICAMGLCGELAYDRLCERDGTSTYRNYLIDEIYNLDGDKLQKGAKYELR